MLVRKVQNLFDAFAFLQIILGKTCNEMVSMTDID